MRPLPYKHFFTVVENQFVWDNPEMFNLIRKVLDGKKGYAIIEEDVAGTTPNQFAYYFGGIIRHECMESNVFAGMTEKEIHNHLLFEVLGNMRDVIMPDGSTKVMNCIPDFDEIKDSKKKMSAYLEKLIPHLEQEYGIYPKPPEHYKYNKFYIKQKTIE